MGELFVSCAARMKPGQARGREEEKDQIASCDVNTEDGRLQKIARRWCVV